MERIPVTIISGYLGSGKTTLLLNILEQRKQARFGFIVNDFSEKNVDADTIERSAFFTEEDVLIPISSGSISTNLTAQLEQALKTLVHEHNVDAVYIEGSGIATPEKIAQIVLHSEVDDKKELNNFLRIDSMITVADGSRLAQQFDPANGKFNDEYIDSNQLITRQIEFCDILLFNKLDLITDNEKNYLKHLLRQLQPTARFIETTFSNVAIEDITNTYLFDESKPLKDTLDTEDLSEQGISEADTLGIESFVYKRRRPFHPARFDAWLDQWPPQITRCKGVMWLITQPNHVFKISQSGRAMDIIPSGYWIASLKQWEIEKLFEIRKHLKDIWHERFGDRMTELVFIGKDMDKQQIIHDLDQCLYLDNEAIPYFNDPFQQDSL